MNPSFREQFFGRQHTTIIEPPKGWRMVDWRELWAYRELIWVLTVRDVKVRYKQAVLGAAWAVIRPLTMMIVFSVVFGRLAKIPSDGYPYPVFVYAALLPWTLFANAIGASGQSLVGSTQLVSKVYFPRLIIPLSPIGTGLVDFAISTIVLLLLMVWYGVEWSTNMLAVPFLLIAVIFVALGVGTLLSALTVAYRDFIHITPFVVQVWMFITPVIFPVQIVPGHLQWILYLNPMTGLIEGFRSAFLGKDFDIFGLAASFTVAAAVLIIGIVYFEKVERRFADII